MSSRHTLALPRHCVSALSAAIALVLMTGPATAQEQTTTDLDRIEVTGVRASIQKSLIDKRNASGIVDAIAAEDMGKFPDLNLSESLQRVSGITLERNTQGEGRAINLRGLGPQFTRVEINGMSGMSNNAGNRSGAGFSEGGRSFNFEIFASELFTKATVHKTSSAEIDEGGMAGTVRLETPRPLDTAGTRVSVSALGNYSDKLGQTDPRAAVLFSHNRDDVFGIAASVAWSKAEFTSDTVENGNWRGFAVANGGIRASDEVRDAWTPTSPAYYIFHQDRETIGSTLTVQFRPSDRISLTLDGLYGTLDGEQKLPRNDRPLESGINAPTDVIIDEYGHIVQGTFTNVQQRVGTRWRSMDETYQQLGARLDWTPNEYWSVKPFVGVAERKAKSRADTYSFRLADADGNFNPGSVTYRIRGDFNDFGSDLTNFDDHPEGFLFNVMGFGSTLDKDREYQARIDVERMFANSEHRLKFGMRYNDRVKDRIPTRSQTLRATGAPIDLPDLGEVFEYMDFHVRKAGSSVPRRLLWADPTRSQQVFMPNGVPLPGLELVHNPGSMAAGTYSIKEKALSGWFQAEFVFAAVQVIPGIRFVRSEQSPSGFSVVNQNLPTQVITPVSISKTYNSYLPSLSARYDLSDTIVLRAAYARTLTRPNLTDLVPSERVSGYDEGGGTGSRGNPNLDPYYANNFDLGAEWYFSSEGLLAANVFYKDISGFIDSNSFTENRTFPHQITGIPVEGPIIFSEPVNAASAKIKGIEVSAQSRFSRLPGFLSNLGGIANWSYTDSSADFSSTGGDVRSQGLPGLSKKSANAVLYYDDGRFDTRLTYVWREHYLAEFDDNFGLPRFTKAYGMWDISLNYHISERLSLQAQVLNLTRTQMVNQSVGRGIFMPYGVADMDRRFLLGLRMSF